MNQGLPARPRIGKLAWATALLSPLGYCIFRLAGRNPDWVERVYAERAYPPLASFIGWPGRHLPWPLAEVILITLLLVILLGLRGLLRALVGATPGLGAMVLCRVGSLFALAGVLYFGFVLLWGLNYLRPPIGSTLHWPMEKPGVLELQGLCEDLAGEANTLRKGLPSDEKGVLRIDWVATLDHRNLGYERLHGALAPVLPVDLETLTRPKPSLFSPLMSRSLTYGMYIPWTGETLLNRGAPAPALPFSVCHEMAHQYGIAREDEANFVGYLACRLHPDPIFRYSGTRAALSESMAQLRAVRPEAWAAVHATLDPGVLADEASEIAWMRQHRGRFAEVQGRVYDNYLKAQGQADGARSYGRVVDLLIAEKRLRRLGGLPPPLR